MSSTKVTQSAKGKKKKKKYTQSEKKVQKKPPKQQQQQNIHQKKKTKETCHLWICQLSMLKVLNWNAIQKQQQKKCIKMF